MLIISLHVTPKSAKNQILGWTMDAEGRPVLKIKVAAPPEDGKANKALLTFLAKEWDIPKSKLELVSGATGRNKRLKIKDNNLSARLTVSVTKA